MTWRSVDRAAAFVIAALIASAGIYLLIEAHRMRSQVNACRDAKPIDIPVDFSKSGTFSAEFLQTCSIAHTQRLILQLSPSKLQQVSPKESTLVFSYKIMDSTGKAVVSSDPDTWTFSYDNRGDRSMHVCDFPPFSEGAYRLEIVVSQGASSLAGTSQRLVARHLLCGLEAAPPFFAD